MTCKEGTALAGIAPFPRDSDTLKGRRAIWGAYVRAVLHMTALIAMRKNSVIRTRYQRLCQEGKAKKLAQTARTRKLFTISQCNGQEWDTVAV